MKRFRPDTWITKQNPSSPSFSFISFSQSWREAFSNRSCCKNENGSSFSSSPFSDVSPNECVCTKPESSGFATPDSCRMSRRTRVRQSSICSGEHVRLMGLNGSPSLMVHRQTYADHARQVAFAFDVVLGKEIFRRCPFRLRWRFCCWATKCCGLSEQTHWRNIYSERSRLITTVRLTQFDPLIPHTFYHPVESSSPCSCLCIL